VLKRQVVAVATNPCDTRTDFVVRSIASILPTKVTTRLSSLWSGLMIVLISRSLVATFMQHRIKKEEVVSAH
jgi:hypothetical protein